MKEIIGPILTKDRERHYKEIDKAILISFLAGAILGLSLYLNSLGRELLAITGFSVSCYLFIKSRYCGLKGLFREGAEDEG